MRILIVEDEIKIRVGISKLITSCSEHIVVGEAKNGEQGLEMALDLRPELIITDIRMPYMGGLEMLEELRKRNLAFHSIVLTGYAEFEYAQKAIQLSADNYLLKPIGVEDVEAALDDIEEKIRKEQQAREGTPQEYLRLVLLGNEIEARKNCERLKENNQLKNGPYYLFLGYLGGTDAEYLESCRMAFDSDAEHAINRTIFSAYIESTQEFICLVSGHMQDLEQITKRIHRRIFKRKSTKGDAVWGMKRIDEIYQLKDGASHIRQLFPWAMVLGYDHILNVEETKNLSLTAYTHPLELENRIVVSICNGNVEDLRTAADQFVSKISQQKIQPAYIKECYIKITNTILGLTNEVVTEGYKFIQEQNPIQNISIAVTRYEIELCFHKIIEVLSRVVNKKEDFRNYAVNKAIRYIREHYSDGITLEAVAGSLDITPEYLSSLFNREVGMNFSTFVKRFRVSQAKRLLKGSEMKIYEVAAAVGYSDSKYFNRVFKDVTGISPGDFRQS